MNPRDYLPPPPWEGPPSPRKWQRPEVALRHMLLQGIQEETSAIGHYMIWAKQAAILGNHEIANLFEHIKAEEKHHLDELLQKASDYHRQG